jgi:phytoene dehydrogenase-like protein
MADSIIIIGGGIAGLAAGCYGQMNGYRTKIFELHTLPGGLCTAWERKEYIFDGCIHYLFGSGQGQPFNRVWEELGAIRDRKIINHDEFMRVTGPDGRSLILYSDPDRLEQHLKELSPMDARLIGGFTEAVRQFTRFNMSLLQQQPRSLMGPLDWMRLGTKMMPFLPQLTQFGFISAQDFGSRFKDPFLRRAVPLMFAWPEIPMMAGLSMLAYMHTQNAGFPAGGSYEFARAIERRYLELGGEIFYNHQVEKILVENDRAVGVRLYNDEIYRADIVISAADGHGTIYDMLDGRYVTPRIHKFYNGEFPVHSLIQVSLGVNADFSSEPHWVTYLLDQPVLIAGQERDCLSVKNYCFDPSLAPAGKSAVEVMLRINYGYWQHIYGHRLYASEQDQVAEIVIDQLERFYPGIRQKVEVIDVATPLSYERYTGNWQGSSCGWLLTKKTMFYMLTGMRKTLPGLGNFYMIGQWVEPGGMVPVVAMSGRNIIQTICHADHKPFKTSIPE